MTRPRKNFWLDVVLLIQMVALAATGVIMKWTLPPGSGGGRGHGRGWGGGGQGWGAHGHGGGWHGGEEAWGPSTLLGWTRHEWGDFHFWIAVALVATLLLHLVLHWRWIVCRVEEVLFAKGASDVGCEEAPARPGASFRSARSSASFRGR